MKTKGCKAIYSVPKLLRKPGKNCGANLKQTHQYFQSRKPNKTEPIEYFFKLEEVVKQIDVEVIAVYEGIMLVYQIRTHTLQSYSLKEHLIKKNTEAKKY